MSWWKSCNNPNHLKNVNNMIHNLSTFLDVTLVRENTT